MRTYLEPNIIFKNNNNDNSNNNNTMNNNNTFKFSISSSYILIFGHENSATIISRGHRGIGFKNRKTT